MSPCFRAVCRCAQGDKCLVGDDAYNKLSKVKSKPALKDQFSIELVWFPVVVTVRGDLTTYDQPGDSFIRVAYLNNNPFTDDPTKRHPGWVTSEAPLAAQGDTEVPIDCDEHYDIDGKVRLCIGRPRRDVDRDAQSGRCGHRWTPHAAVSDVVICSRTIALRTSDAGAAVPRAVPCAVRRRTRWRCLTRSRRSTRPTERAETPTMP